MTNADMVVVTVNNERKNGGRALGESESSGTTYVTVGTGSVSEGSLQRDSIGSRVDPLRGIVVEIGDQRIGGGHGDELVNLMPAQQFTKLTIRISRFWLGQV
jgi:hypothetical protein